MISLELKPCPFCGGEASFERNGTSRQSCIVVCESCGCRFESGEKGDACGNSWNTRAVNTHDELVKALDGMVLVCGRTGDHFEDFEEQAEVFHRETGLMRPGKSVPMEMARDDEDVRRTAYSNWVTAKLAEGRAALTKARAKPAPNPQQKD